MKMPTSWRLLMTCLSFVALLPATAGAGPLPPEVEVALDRAQVPQSAFVAVVQEVGGTSTRLAWQPQQPVNPASLMKLLTTTAALDLLGPAWTWNTPVWMQGSVLNGVLDGNLVVKGTGDPRLVQERLWLMLRRVQQLGVREIRGDIVLDRGAFSAPEQNAGDFDGEPFKPYNVRPDALLLNYKSVLLTFTPDLTRGVAIVSSEPPLSGVRVDLSVPLVGGPCDDWRGALKADFNDPLRMRFAGHYAAACAERQWPVAYADPRNYNGRLLAGLWREMGGKLVGRAREGIAPTDPPNFELNSPPLAEVVRDINKFSNNVMAQQLFLTLGLTQRGAGTPEAARAVMRQWLADRQGELANAAVIDNGSGLSRDGRVTAMLLARVLQSAWSSPVMPELMSSLPVSGIDGTMRRAKNSVPGRAHLKTGSLRDVVGIAGYVLAPSGRRYVVVAVVNHANANAARPALEAMVQWTSAETPATVPPPLPLPPPLLPAVPPPAASEPAASSVPAAKAPTPRRDG
jgi:D-alanyl-D-alanine carboxypeptidase/D-alanyl-D-alanine-endopeptidase (penicillin-binding protein 4)